MGDPVFWLAISLLVVCLSLAAAIAMVVPAMLELGRAARSAEKLFDTLNRELPPTLEAIRLTGLEISDLTDDMTSGVQQAGQVVQKVDRSFDGARYQVRRAGLISRRTAAGVRAAWRSLTRPPKKRRSSDRLPTPTETAPEPRYSRSIGAGSTYDAPYDGDYRNDGESGDRHFERSHDAGYSERTSERNGDDAGVSSNPLPADKAQSE